MSTLDMALLYDHLGCSALMVETHEVADEGGEA